MATVLPLVAKYGGAVVALTLDEDGIPPTADGRVAIAKKIVARGAEYGLKPSDFVVDVLCLAVSADSSSANVILEAMRRVRSELGCRTCLGVSNISFGLPARPLLNATFYTMALANGLSAGIVNPLAADMMTAYRAYRALAGKDPACGEWVEKYRDWTPGTAAESASTKTAAAGQNAAESPGGIAAAIRRGLKSDAAAAAKAALASGRAPLVLCGFFTEDRAWTVRNCRSAPTALRRTRAPRRMSGMSRTAAWISSTACPRTTFLRSICAGSTDLA